ncbi:MAG: anti-sigma factor domain-containing protein [Phycisphaerales bacterium]
MSRTSRNMPPGDDRLLDLLAARAVEGLTPREQRELEALLAVNPGVDADRLELAAAAIDEAFRAGDASPMPASLRERIAAAGERTERGVVARLDGGVISRRSGASRFIQAAGWLMAAACLVLALLGWWPRLVPATRPPATLAQQFNDLLAEPDAVVADWADWDNPEIAGVQGGVVWSPSRQAGFMRFTGLPANNPAQQQYQLWIVDERGLADPVTGQSARISGGVFDADSSGVVIVPIDAKLQVGSVKLFAVTIEKPGGTWVSDMTRRVVVGPANKG